MPLWVRVFLAEYKVTPSAPVFPWCVALLFDESSEGAVASPHDDRVLSLTRHDPASFSFFSSLSTFNTLRM